jgi:hypothetical protein
VAFVLAGPTAHAQDEGEKPKQQDPPRRQRPQFGGLPIEQLKEKLALSDEQVKKLEQINEESNAEFRKEMQELQKDGNLDYAKMREIMPKRMAALKEKVKEVLTEEQKPKFEEWSKEQEKQMKRQGNGFGRDPESMKKRLYDQAEKELTLTADEKNAVMPLVQKVLDARAEARVNGDKRRAEFTEFVKKVGGTDEAAKNELQKKLDEFRKAREAEQARIRDAQQALREVLTIENEAKLVAIGILD